MRFLRNLIHSSMDRGLRHLTINLTPPVVLILTYGALLFTGAALLMLPVAAPEPLTWSEAVFTATSAITVTGLAVVDTGSGLTLFGQAVVLFLIQLGGLGLMTFAVLILSALGLSVGFNQQMILKDDLNQTSVRDLLKLVRVILTVVVACEAIGTVILCFVFIPAFGFWAGLWSAFFHAVSAFNNAGFSLYPDSLTRWATDPVVNLTVPALFMVGGLGYVVLSDILSTKSWRAWSLHSKLMIVGTVALTVIGCSLFAILEWDNPDTLGAYASTGDRLWISWFQGVTPRTAGFNTVDFAKIDDTTALMTMILMFIGGGSTSTAGGIKVTTAIVLVLATIAFFKRRQTLVAFGRSIGLEETLKVMALTTIAIGFVVFGSFVVTVTHKGDFLDSVFEVVSAFGTVGLSRGATVWLGDVDRAVICVIMFFGRVGPLTTGFFLATRVRSKVRYPAGRVYLG